MEDAQPQGPSPTSAGASEPRLRLRSLKVHAFRDVRPGTELHFGDGFHLVLGKNASGKSTLLRLLAAAAALDFGASFFAETPLHLEVSLAVGGFVLDVDLRRSFEAPEPGVLGSLAAQEKAEAIIRIEHETTGLRSRLVARTGEACVVALTAPNKVDGDVHGPPLDPLRLSVFGSLFFGLLMRSGEMLTPHHAVLDAAADHAVETPCAPSPFDEALGTLLTLTRLELTIDSLFSLGRSSAWLPRALEFVATGEPVNLDLSKDPLLAKAIHLLGFDAARAYFGPAASSPNGRWTYSSPAFQFFRNGKAVRRHDQLSFGQQRLFSFAWYLACSPDVAIADELVNGLHSEWIDWCVEAIADRQCFLTAQNPLLVDAVPLRTAEDLRRGIILCSSSPDASRDRDLLSFRQLDEGEVDLVSRALQTSRLDLLSDLLHALELW